MIDYTNSYARNLIRGRMIEAENARLAGLARSATAARRGSGGRNRLLARAIRFLPGGARRSRPDTAIGATHSLGSVR